MEHGVVDSEEMKGNCCAAQTFSYKKLERHFCRSRVSWANSRGHVYLALQNDAACNLMSSGVWCGVS